MGVSHSMDDGQVERVSAALKGSAEAIQGINKKFDMIDEHWQRMQDFNEKINTKVEGTLDSFRRLDDTLTGRADLALDAVMAATEGMSHVLEETLHTLQRFDMDREMDRLPKVIMPLCIPLIILLIELAVANAYLGILLSSLPDIRLKYSNYLLANAGSVLLGLTLSLAWLGIYRAWLAYKTRRTKLATMPQEPVDEVFPSQGRAAEDPDQPLAEPPEPPSMLGPLDASLQASWEVLPPQLGARSMATQRTEAPRAVCASAEDPSGSFGDERGWQEHTEALQGSGAGPPAAPPGGPPPGSPSPPPAPDPGGRPQERSQAAGGRGRGPDVSWRDGLSLHVHWSTGRGARPANEQAAPAEPVGPRGAPAGDGDAGMSL